MRRATINRLNLYRSKVKRDKSGAIVKGGLPVGQQVRDMQAARVQPDAGNTRSSGSRSCRTSASRWRRRRRTRTSSSAATSCRWGC